MSNTLSTSNTKELHIALQSYNSYLCEIPKQFDVLDEYLHGLSADDFCRAFRHLQEIVASMYHAVSEDPQFIGLTAKDKKTDTIVVQTSQHISCIKKMLYVIGRFSKLEENTLTISMHTFMNAYMTYYPNNSVELAENIKEFDAVKQSKFYKAKHLDLVVNCYKSFGFDIHCQQTEICIQYPKDPAVITVIKSFATAEICRISFGFDFTKFNYRVFAYPSNGKLPLEALYSYSLLCAEQKQFLSKLNDALSEIKTDYGKCAGGWYSGTLPCQYNYKNKVRIMQNIESGLIPFVVMRFGKKAEKMARFIESLPEEYKCRIERCKGCRKGECDHRIPVTTKDTKFVLCNVAWWHFPATVDAIPYIVAAYKIV